VCEDTRPASLVDHLLVMASLKRVPLCLLPQSSVALGHRLGLRCASAAALLVTLWLIAFSLQLHTYFSSSQKMDDTSPLLSVLLPYANIPSVPWLPANLVSPHSVLDSAAPANAQAVQYLPLQYDTVGPKRPPNASGLPGRRRKVAKLTQLQRSRTKNAPASGVATMAEQKMAS